MIKIKKTPIICTLLVFMFVFLLSSVNVFAASEQVTWSPSDKNTYVSLSNNNLTVRSTGTSVSNCENTGVRATLGKSSGKWYWEYHIDAAGDPCVGIANSSAPLGWIWNGEYGNTAEVYGFNGRIYPIGKTVTHPSINSIVGVALDLDNKTVIFYLDGVMQGTPIDISAIGSPVYPFYTNASSANDSTVTANFGATPFQYAIPSGYEPYEGEQISAPANLTATTGNSQATLTWNSADGATSYNVKRSTTAGGPYTAIAEDVTDTTYADTDVVNGIVYYYVVTAVSSEGESVNSNEASAMPQAGQQEYVLSVLLNVDETVQLSVTYNLADNAEFAWTSSDEAVAAVDDNGKVTAIAEGTAYIYAKNEDESFSEYIPIKVVPSGADEMRLAVHLTTGEQARLYLSDDTDAITWSSADESIATVTSDGEVTAVQKGLVIIRGELDGKTYQIYVRVNV